MRPAMHREGEATAQTPVPTATAGHAKKVEITSMGETTNISWTDHTFNPWWGCTKVSAGCDHCYAETLSKRMGGDVWGHGKLRRRTSAKNWQEPVKWNREAEKRGVRKRVFCASMADVFDNEVPIEWLRDLLDLIRITPNLDWQLLTKRPSRIKRALNTVMSSIQRENVPEPDIYWTLLFCWIDDWLHHNPPKNVWLGTSVENQDAADARIPLLLKVPAAIRFLSVEPLIGPVDLSRWIGRSNENTELRGAGLPSCSEGLTGNRHEGIHLANRSEAPAEHRVPLGYMQVRVMGERRVSIG